MTTPLTTELPPTTSLATRGLLLDSRQRAMLLEMGVRVWLPSATLDASASKITPRTSPVRKPGAHPSDPQAPPLPDKVTQRPSAPSATAQREPPLRLPVLERPPMHTLGAQTRFVIANMPATTSRFDCILLGEPCTGDAEKLLANITKALGGASFTAQMVPASDDGVQLLDQLKQLTAKAVLVLGPHSAKALLAEAAQSTPFSKLRGQAHTISGFTVPVFVTYHPLQLLRQPLAKAQTWLDLRPLLKAIR